MTHFSNGSSGNSVKRPCSLAILPGVLEMVLGEGGRKSLWFEDHADRIKLGLDLIGQSTPEQLAPFAKSLIALGRVAQIAAEH